MTVVSIEIEAADDGKQVHKWLRLLLPGMPLSGIHKFIRTGRIKVNGKRAKRDTVLHAEDIVNLFMTQEDYDATRKSSRQKYAGVSSSLDVRFENDEFLIVNKPPGVLVHASDRGDYASTLQAQVEAYVYRSAPPSAGQAFSPSPVHRLDRNTSGLVIFAKTSRAAREFGKRFESSAVKKLYVAIVQGEVTQGGRIDVALSRENDMYTKVDRSSGKESLTTFRPLASTGTTSCLAIQIETGRTHQIRVHLAHIRHPLVNDVKYGGQRGKEPLYLHAARLCLDSELDVVAPLPLPFRKKLIALGYDSEKIEEMLEAMSSRP